MDKKYIDVDKLMEFADNHNLSHLACNIAFLCELEGKND